MRYRVEPRDVPPAIAARRLGLAQADFEAKLPKLIARGFPSADQDTGNYDLDAIDEWRRLRNPHLFGLTTLPPARDARMVVRDRLARMRDG